jgi:hypothetical protein
LVLWSGLVAQGTKGRQHLAAKTPTRVHFVGFPGREALLGCWEKRVSVSGRNPQGVRQRKRRGAAAPPLSPARLDKIIAFLYFYILNDFFGPSTFGGQR